jgi:toxin ParE1/3/4
MTRALSFRPEAEEDLNQAFDWYEQAEPGLGLEFLRAVDVCVRFIERQPLASPVARGGIRKAVLRRFPYGLFYAIEAEKIAVLACLHSKRNPSSWPRQS